MPGRSAQSSTAEKLSVMSQRHISATACDQVQSRPGCASMGDVLPVEVEDSASEISSVVDIQMPHRRLERRGEVVSGNVLPSLPATLVGGPPASLAGDYVRSNALMDQPAAQSGISRHFATTSLHVTTATPEVRHAEQTVRSRSAARSAQDGIGGVSARACVLTSAPESPCSSAPGVMPKRRRRSSKVCLDAAQASLLAPAPTAAFGGAHLAATPSLAARSAEDRIGRASARACATAPTAPGSLGRSMPRAPQPSGPFPDAAVGKASALPRGGACGMSVGDGSESETPQRLVPAAARASSGMRREMSGPAARDGSSEDDVEMYAAPAPRLVPAPAASFDGAHLAATPSLGARSAEDRIGRASARACVTAPTVPGSLGRSTNRPSDAAAAARVASGMQARMAAPAARLEEDNGEDSEYSDAEAVEQRTATAPQRANRFPEACMHSAQASLLAPAPTAAFGGAHLAATPSLAARSAEDRIGRASARACATAPTAPGSLGRSMPRAPQPSGPFPDAAVGKASALPRGGACGMSVGDGSESETPQRLVPAAARASSGMRR